MTLKEELKRAIEERDLIRAIQIVRESPGVAQDVLAENPRLKQEVDRLLRLMEEKRYREAYEQFKNNPVALAFISKETVREFVNFVRQKAFVAELNMEAASYYGDESGMWSYVNEAAEHWEIGTAFALPFDPNWVTEKEIEIFGRKLKEEGIFPEGFVDRVLEEMRRKIEDKKGR